MKAKTKEELFGRVVPGGAFRKIVCSRAVDGAEKRLELVPYRKGDEIQILCERFMQDGKVFHETLSGHDAAARLCALCGTDYRQVDVLTACGTGEVRVSAGGRVTVTDKIQQDTADTVSTEVQRGHNREKARFVSPDAPFLRVLGICDSGGRVHDRMQPKYRQICRFLELLDDAYGHLPQQGTLTVFDLCCGKSYLSFAIYHYLTAVRGRTVCMTGVDRKSDVIAFCADAATRCGYTGLQFLCGDIERDLPPQRPDLVVSLHACDIATDLVLASAVARAAGVILSTPCCQHEVFHTMNCPALSFVTEQSILAQKFADAATDALRCKWLQAQGYTVRALELVDPEQTPKNVLIRAVRAKNATYSAQAAEEYRRAAALLGTAPSRLPLPDEPTEEKENPSL